MVLVTVCDFARWLGCLSIWGYFRSHFNGFKFTSSSFKQHYLLYHLETDYSLTKIFNEWLVKHLPPLRKIRSWLPAIEIFDIITDAWKYPLRVIFFPYVSRIGSHRPFKKLFDQPAPSPASRNKVNEQIPCRSLPICLWLSRITVLPFKIW